MKCLIINPNSDQLRKLLRNGGAFLRRTGGVFPSVRPPLVVTYTDQAASVPELIELFQQKGEEYDGFVLACHGTQPGISTGTGSRKACVRNRSGIYEIAAMREMDLLFDPLGQLFRKSSLARKYHCEEQLKTVQVPKRPVRGPFGGCTDCFEGSWSRLYCPRLCQLQRTGGVEAQLGVPVIDGLLWALFFWRESSIRSQKEAPQFLSVLLEGMEV